MLKQTFITLGLASGMTAAALFYFHNVNACRAMVVAEIKANDAFIANIQPTDFLTALTKGK